MAEPSGNPSGPPHAARTTHACGVWRRLPSPAIKSTRLLRAPFHFVHTAGVVTRTRNVSEYMLVLTLCKVDNSSPILHYFVHYVVGYILHYGGITLPDWTFCSNSGSFMHCLLFLTCSKNKYNTTFVQKIHGMQSQEEEKS